MTASSVAPVPPLPFPWRSTSLGLSSVPITFEQCNASCALVIIPCLLEMNNPGFMTMLKAKWMRPEKTEWSQHRILQRLRPFFSGDGRALFTAMVMIGIQTIISPSLASPPTNTVRVVSDRMTLELTPMPLDAAEAFFLGRGFGGRSAKRIAREGCVHKLVVRNILKPSEKGAVYVDLAQWRVNQDDGIRPVTLKREWAEKWDAWNVEKPARIAFQWALFPTEQTFWPGDENWGLVTLGLTAGSDFQLELVWYEENKKKRRLVPPLRCATNEERAQEE